MIFFNLPAGTRVQCKRMKQNNVVNRGRIVVFGTVNESFGCQTTLSKRNINNILIYNES